MAQLIWLFKLLADACVAEIDKRTRPHSVFTAPEAIDSTELWIREYQAAAAAAAAAAVSGPSIMPSIMPSRLQQVTEIIRTHPHMLKFIDDFRHYESIQEPQATAHLVWALENILKHSGKWTKKMTWLIIMCIVHEDLPESKAFDIWRQKHTDGWSKAYVAY
jgi:hypothetical protein